MNALYVITGVITLIPVRLSRSGITETGVVRMNIYSWLQLFIYIVVLIALAKPLGSFMAKVYEGKHTFLDRVLKPVERFIYRLAGVNPEEEMNWKTYAIAVLLFNAFGLVVVYALQRFQAILPLNPRDLARSRLIPPGTQRSVLRPTPTGRDMAAR